MNLQLRISDDTYNAPIIIWSYYRSISKPILHEAFSKTDIDKINQRLRYLINVIISHLIAMRFDIYPNAYIFQKYKHINTIIKIIFSLKLKRTMFDLEIKTYPIVSFIYKSIILLILFRILFLEKRVLR